MKNINHIEILKEGVDVWNAWRKKNPSILPLFFSADLRDADLRSVNLSNAILIYADLRNADLRHADLGDAILRQARLNNANLSGADLTSADFHKANLTRADMSQADLNDAILTRTNLREANLTGGILFGVNFNRSYLSGVNFSKGMMGWVTFGDNDLSEVIGLDTVIHRGPSTVGIDTIYRSNGKIPELFLKGAGVPEVVVTYAKSLTNQSIQFYSCFISFSSKNQAFAERLHADMQNKGVRSWFAPEDLKIGERINVGIDESIRVHDKLLLVLSRYSVASNWVEKEVETAMEQERLQKRTILFPIRLDNTVMKVESGWPADIRRTRHIGDFSKWRQHEAYQKALDRLLRDLKAESSETEREDWTRLSLESFARACSDDEPEYSLGLIKEANPANEGR